MRILILLSLLTLVACGNKATGPIGPSDEKVAAFVEAFNDTLTVQVVSVVKQYTARGGQWVIIEDKYQGGGSSYMAYNLEYFTLGDTMNDFLQRAGAAYNTMNANVVNEQDKLDLHAAFPHIYSQNFTTYIENNETFYTLSSSWLDLLVGGFSQLDSAYVRSELEKAFTFSQEEDSEKDLETLGFKVEVKEIDDLEAKLTNFGLSAERSGKIAKIANHFSKITSRRALTPREKDQFTKELTGLNFDQAATEMVEDYDSLLEKAAELNETSPEAIKELINTIM